MFCTIWWRCVYTDVTLRQRIVVECWISLQGITHRPSGNCLPPTKTEREGEEIIVVGRTGRVICVRTEIFFFLKEECTVSYSRARHLPLLHWYASGIHLPVVLDSTAHFPSTFPQSLHKLIAKFKASSPKCLQYSHHLWYSLKTFYLESYSSVLKISMEDNKY